MDTGIRPIIGQNQSTRPSCGLIIPVFKDETTEIEYFLDQDLLIYNNFHELLTSGYERYYFIEYEVVFYHFEKWCRLNGFSNKFRPGKYTKGPNSSSWYLPKILKSDVVASAPLVLNTRGGYFYKDVMYHFRFFNAESFVRSLNVYNLDMDIITEAYNVIREIEDFYPYLTTQRQGMPNGIAALARKLFPDPTKICNQEKKRFLMAIKSSYKGGLYYLKAPLVRYKKVYNYDIRSLYPFVLATMKFPNPKTLPKIQQGFIEVDNNNQLAFYHISTMAIKSQLPFNVEFTVMEEQDRLIKEGVKFKQNGVIKTTKPLSLIEGWITSIDYYILKRFYEIREMTIDRTIVVDDLVCGSEFFGQITHFYQKKEESVGARRTMYKLILDSYTGSLGRLPFGGTYQLDSLNKDDIEEVIKAIPMDSGAASPLDMAAFVNAYGRLRILNFIDRIPKDKIEDILISIDTDGFWTTEPVEAVDKVCGEKLGDIRLDKVMYDAIWYGNKQYASREDSPDAPITPHIAGLPAFLYKEGSKEYFIPQIVYDVRKKTYIKRYSHFTLIGG